MTSIIRRLALLRLCSLRENICWETYRGRSLTHGFLGILHLKQVAIRWENRNSAIVRHFILNNSFVWSIDDGDFAKFNLWFVFFFCERTNENERQDTKVSFSCFLLFFYYYFSLLLLLLWPLLHFTSGLPDELVLLSNNQVWNNKYVMWLWNLEIIFYYL